MKFKYAYRWIKGLSRKSACCGSKMPWDKEHAEKARVAMEKKHNPKKFDKYWCPWCRHWHIGRSVKDLEIK